jgi:hypothetical protein
MSSRDQIESLTQLAFMNFPRNSIHPHWHTHNLRPQIKKWITRRISTDRLARRVVLGMRPGPAPNTADEAIRAVDHHLERFRTTHFAPPSARGLGLHVS